MARGGLGSTIRIGRPPFYRALGAFAASCFVGTFATDIVYWRTTDVLWVDFSDWLVTIGVIVGYMTIVVALIETFVARSPLRRRPTWPYALGNVVALILATVNLLVHTRDAWTSVVPWGLVLSAAVVIVLILTYWTTRETYRLGSAEVNV